MRLIKRLLNPQQAHAAIMDAWNWAKPHLIAGAEMEITVKRATRTMAQNSRLWAMLTDISRQVDWHGQKLTPEEFKHVFTAALSRQKVVPGIDGGFVVLGKSTSSMTKSEMSELQELMAAFGAEHQVNFGFEEEEWINQG